MVSPSHYRGEHLTHSVVVCPKLPFFNFCDIVGEHTGDVIPERERGWLGIMMVELASFVDRKAGRGMIIHVLFGPLVCYEVTRKVGL